jgi:Short C-terminal domain
MPLLFRPRRPLLRGAMLGGTAYLAGKAGARAQERTYAEQAAEAEQDQRLAALESQPAATPPVYSGTDGSPLVAELTKLKDLLDSGVLNEAEFNAAKQRMLAGS